MADILNMNLLTVINNTAENLQEHFKTAQTGYLKTYRFLSYNLLQQTINAQNQDPVLNDKVIKIAFAIDTELYKRGEIESPKKDLINKLKENNYPIPDYLKDKSVTNILNGLIDFKSTTTEQKVIQSAGFFIGFGIAFSSKLKNESNRIYYIIGLAIAGLVIGTIASQLLSKKKINN